MQFTSQSINNNILIKARLSAICLCGMVIAGCTSSDDPVVQVNVDPVAVNDSFTVIKSGATILDIADNDTDTDDGLDLTSIVIVTGPGNGTVAVNTNGTVTYAHDGSDTAADSFTYNIRDNSGAVSNTAGVAITVTPAVPPSSIQAGIYDSTVVEGADDLEFVVSLSAASSEIVSVDYATTNGTAEAGTDYIATGGSIRFAPGELRKFITVAVLNNASAATVTNKNMQLVLSNPQNTEISDDTATGTIIDNNRDAIAAETEFKANWDQVGAFTNAARCGADCHKSDGSIMAFKGKDISPGTQWQHSVMANAFNDPYWQAAVEDEVDSFPALAGFIENTCIKCHAPNGAYTRSPY